MPLTLLVPDLLPPVDAPAALREVRLPGLEKALGRADVTREGSDGAYGWLGTEWGVAPPVPFAAIALAGEDQPREGTWMRADPVHLRIERDLVALHDASVLDVGKDESEALVGALQALFLDDGLEFHATAPDRWYVRLSGADAPQTTPLHAAVGRDIFTLLPRGAGPLNWRSMITESQMVLSGHEANARRDEAGLPAINSVWFWGEGALPAAVAPRYAQVYANDAFARGLARLAGVATRPLPERFEGLDVPDADAETLVVLDDLTRPMRRADVDSWVALAKSLDQRWFAPAAKARSAFAPVRLVLTGEGGAVVATLTSRAKWRFLNRSRRLADLA